MILITIKHQDGEREYTSYHYKKSFPCQHCNEQLEISKEFYDASDDLNPPYKGDAIEENIIKEIYDGWDLKWDEDQEAWWHDTSLVWIEDVHNLSKNQFETLIELGILYK